VFKETTVIDWGDWKLNEHRLDDHTTKVLPDQWNHVMTDVQKKQGGGARRQKKIKVSAGANWGRLWSEKQLEKINKAKEQFSWAVGKKQGQESKNPWVKEGDEVMRKILVLSFLVLIASPAWGAVAVEQKLLEERAVYQRILNPTTQ
jgi:hypothetical protein